MVLRLRPKRGGFLRPFGCGWFIREFLSGNSPYGAPFVNPNEGAPQADIFFHYKTALIREIAINRAVRDEEKRAKKGKRSISPDSIDKLTEKHLAQIPFKSSSCTYHSFVVYFSNLIRLGWVEYTGQEERSSMQDYYPPAQSRRYYRLTAAGMGASDSSWANPQTALYGGR